jgi:hypothetical protein
MFDGLDLAFASQLERWILRELHGDQEKVGLVRSALNSRTMEELARTKGIIDAYEAVIEAMKQIAQKMNEPQRREDSQIIRMN